MIGMLLYIGAMIGMLVIACKVWNNLAKKVDHPFLLNRDWMISLAVFAFIPVFLAILSTCINIHSMDNSNPHNIDKRKSKQEFFVISFNKLQFAIYLITAVIITLYLAKIVKPEIAEKTIQVFTWTFVAILTVFIVLFISFVKTLKLEQWKEKFLKTIDGELNFQREISTNDKEAWTNKIKTQLGELVNSLRDGKENDAFPNIIRIFKTFKNSNNYSEYNKNNKENNYDKTLGYHMLNWIFEELEKTEKTIEFNIFQRFLHKYKWDIYNNQNMHNDNKENYLHYNANDDTIKKHIIDSIMSPKQELDQTFIPSTGQKIST